MAIRESRGQRRTGPRRKNGRSTDRAGSGHRRPCDRIARTQPIEERTMVESARTCRLVVFLAAVTAVLTCMPASAALSRFGLSIVTRRMRSAGRSNFSFL